MTTNETVITTANQSKRTFSLKTIDGNGNVTAEYETYEMTQEEFDSMEFDTANDWKHFLNNCNDYYKI